MCYQIGYLELYNSHAAPGVVTVADLDGAAKFRLEMQKLVQQKIDVPIVCHVLEDFGLVTIDFYAFFHILLTN